jgi:quinol monooxygenase YgiN
MTLMIILRITVHALPEKQKELMQTLHSMIEPTAKEKGCLSYDVFRDIEDDNVFSLIEAWKNREDLEHHFRSDRFGVLLGTKCLLSEPLKIQIHTVSQSEEMEGIETAGDKRTNSFGAGEKRSFII